MGSRVLFTLKSPREHTEIKLSYVLYDIRRIRGFALPVSFNGGKPLRLLMDSGAGGILLNRKAADAAGLPKIADVKFSGIGDAGERTGYTAFAEKVDIGDAAFENCPVAVSERKFLTDEDGLIGTNVFSAFLITVDFQRMVLKLDPLPKRTVAAVDANWQDREVSLEFHDFTQFWRVGHEILLPPRVNGAKPVLFLVDTGSSSSLIDPVYANQFTDVRGEDRITMKGLSGKVNKVQSAGRMTFEFSHYRQPVPSVLAIPLAKVTRDPRR